MDTTPRTAHPRTTTATHHATAAAAPTAPGPDTAAATTPTARLRPTLRLLALTGTDLDDLQQAARTLHTPALRPAAGGTR
ncbi:hypothetical protein [Kitasatospora sp. NPDC090091]|uniref:hypothetical protein n=1 Tax=Kitasatospora sp. NPDC090091 TaxID=3364081 RepID=UPI0038069A59